MKHILPRKARRRGAVIPLFAVLLIPLLGMLAFSIDIGYITLVSTDLQIAADAAALAGAEKLQEFYVQYTLPGQTYQSAILTAATTHTAGSAMDMAQQFASYNQAGNIAITLRDEDITFSYMDGNRNFYKNYNGVGLGGGFPNSITVIARRDRISNSPVSLFFGPLLGFAAKELTATATATIYSGDVTSLQAIPGVKAHILPVALDVNVWTTFYQTGKSPDGTVHTAANGYPQLHIYPCPGDAPGNLGLLDVGPPQSNVPAFKAWTDAGQSPNDITYLISRNLVPVSMSSPKNWKCGPVLKSTIQAAFYREMGVPNLIPLFLPAQAPTGLQALAVGSYQAAGTTEESTSYAIVGFAGVSISQADANGSTMDISIQPRAFVDPTASILMPAAAGTQTSQFGSSTIITTFVSAKLTQ